MQTAPNFDSVEAVEKVILLLDQFKDNKEGVNYCLWKDGNLSGLFTVNSAIWDTQTADVGYWLTESATGKGLAYLGLCRITRQPQKYQF